jgi:hypothetical protein
MNEFPSKDNSSKFELFEKIARSREKREDEAAKARRAELELELDISKLQRREFLENTNAAPAPLETYALWLKTYLLQGNNITHSYDYPYPRPKIIPGESIKSMQLSYIDKDGPHYSEVARHYTDQNVYWMPLKPFDAIPTGYGSTAMTILLMPDIDISEEALKPTSGDTRCEWEFGHTTILRLKHDKNAPYGLSASTNQPSHIVSYPDVEKYIIESE